MTVERRWIIGLVVGLTISLAANFIVAGLIIAHRMDTPPPAYAMTSPGVVEEMFGDMSPDGRAAMRDSLRDARKELRETFRTMKGLRQQIKAILDAEVLDRAALEATLDQMAALTNQIQSRLHKSFVDGVSRMSPEDRRTFRSGRPPGERPAGPPPDGPPPPQ